MTAIRKLQALRASYRKAGKLREVKAIDRAITVLREEAQGGRTAKETE